MDDSDLYEMEPSVRTYVRSLEARIEELEAELEELRVLPKVGEWEDLKAENARLREYENKVHQQLGDLMRENASLESELEGLRDQLQAVTRALEEAIKLAKRRNGHDV